MRPDTCALSEPSSASVLQFCLFQDSHSNDVQLTWMMLMAVKLPPRPWRPQLVNGSCRSPNRPLMVLSMATMRPKLVKPNSAPKME